MGTLVVMHYPTSLFAKAADHTYVECGTGLRAWSCWGGKTGGAPLRQAVGSTARADAIAEPNERANITCYLVNGVCHQAANRILLPAAITVNGARGYPVSQALYGVYGRAGTWPCSAPFNQYPNVAGDLAECVPPAPPTSAQHALAAADQLDWHYLQGVLPIYRRYDQALFAEAPSAPTSDESRRAFHLALFEHMVDFQLGPILEDTTRTRLLEIRRETEEGQLAAELDYANERLRGPELVDLINSLTIDFQQRIGESTTDAQYETLFGLSKDEQIVLADPQITSEAFGR
jgi:hypothetical protein